MNYQLINLDQKRQLIDIIQETSLYEIQFDEFEEQLTGLIDDIAGLDCLTTKELSTLINECWYLFQKQSFHHADNQ